MIFDYFGMTRGVGHTTALLKGLPDNCLVLVGTASQGKLLEKRAWELGSRVIPITLGQFESKSRGMNLPLVIDNYAFVQLWVEARQSMRMSDKEIKRLNGTIKEQADWINILSGKKQP